MQSKDRSKSREANPLRYLFGKTWHYSAENRDKIVWYWIMFIVASTLSLVLYPFVVRKLVDIIQREGITSANINLIQGLLAITIVIQLIFWGLHGPARLIERANAFRVRATYRKHLLKGVMTLPMDWHVEHHSGDTIDKVEKGASGLYDFSQVSFEIIYAVVQLTVSYTMLIYFISSAAYIVVAMIVITGWITMRFDRVLVGQYKELNRAENKISESVFDAISNITTVIILRVEKLVFETIARKIDQPFELYKRNSRLNEMKWFLMSMCCVVMSFLVLRTYCLHNLNMPKGAVVANVVIIMQYIAKISETFAKFASMYGEILQRKAKVMNAEELAEDFKAANFANHVLPEGWQKLRVDGLNFSYHNGDEVDLHLEDISLSLARGERIALTGGSGGGKTTLLKIMRDLYHPRSITLSVDGMEISQGFEGISRAIALVPQDPEIFATTILENITLGAEYDSDFVRRFTDMACFTDVVESLPRGFDSLVQEKGVSLSGGQRQRLALARGLLACHDKDIVLLDEPTSSLDGINQMSFYQNIFAAFEGKTIISSTHSLHLLPLFDRICFMSEGRIIASGSLNDLLLTCPEFQVLWQKYHENRHEATVA